MRLLCLLVIWCAISSTNGQTKETGFKHFLREQWNNLLGRDTQTWKKPKIAQPVKSNGASQSHGHSPQHPTSGYGPPKYHHPVNCKLSYFKEGPCSKTCGGGYKTFQRTVIQQATYGGKQCYGALSKTESCNNQPCSVDCILSDFKEGPCSGTCGGGYKTFTRTVIQKAEHYGKECYGPLSKSESCNNQPCPVDCLWTEFQYTECSNPCGGGTMVGTRSIFRPAQYGGKSCSGPSEVNATCNSDPEGAPSLFQVLEEQETSVVESYVPCTGDEIRSCVRIDVNFDKIGQSNRLKVFCTSVERKRDLSESEAGDTQFYEAADFAYLVLTRNDRLGYESIHGTFKIPGNGSYAIENCGEGCHVVIEKNGDNARHPPYDESNLINDDTQLPIETQELLRRGMDDNNTTATVSLIVYYTEEFRRATPDPQGHIDGLIVTANLGFVNSDIPLRLAVHCTLETDIGEAPTSKGRLRQFFESQGSIEGLLQSADFALLLTESVADNGVGGEVDGVNPLRNPGKYTFAWASKNYKGAFAHELGHILGARHDRNATGETRFSNNPEHGYFIDPIPVQQLGQSTPTYRYTIMATGDDTCLDGTPEDCSRFDNGAGRLPYFSVPRTQNGATLGTPEEDNTFEITRSRFYYSTVGDESLPPGQCSLKKEISVLLYPTTLLTKFVPAFFT